MRIRLDSLIVLSASLGIAGCALTRGPAATTLPVFVSGGKALTQVTPYVTSATDNLAAQPVIGVTNANFTATLGAQTVTTFVSN